MSNTVAPDIQVAHLKSQIDDAQSAIDKAVLAGSDTAKHRRRLASLQLELSEAERRVTEAAAHQAEQDAKCATAATAALLTETASELNAQFEQHGAAYRVQPTDERLAGFAAAVVKARIQLIAAIAVEARAQEDVAAIERLIADKVKRSNEIEEARLAGQDMGAAELYALSRDTLRLQDFMKQAEERVAAASSVDAHMNVRLREAELERSKFDILAFGLREQVDSIARALLEAVRVLRETTKPGSTRQLPTSVLDVWTPSERLRQLAAYGHLFP